MAQDVGLFCRKREREHHRICADNGKISTGIIIVIFILSICTELSSLQMILAYRDIFCHFSYPPFTNGQMESH